MKKRNKRWLSSLLCASLIVTLIFAGCTKKEAPATQAENSETPIVAGEVMIAAAASLQNAFEDTLIPEFNKIYPDVKIVGTFDSSGKLQEQIEAGLDADIFFSAATKQMDALVEKAFVNSADVTSLLENEVVLITRKGSETPVTGFENMTEASQLAIGDPASVPAGQYAQEILQSLGLWDSVSAKASLGTNVTEVLNWVSEGSADVGIVYATDAASISDKVEIIAKAPAGSLKTPVVYPIAKLKNSSPDRTAAVDAFLEYLKSPDAAQVFEQYGFKPL
ncbi:MAG: molybdate ABC transporter substrate-binding protein [Clostridiales Family XIII bacterium]|jgi:molybdate transport system substrate-binding protein|nr:molybdate ABC transporter substrate-binding protein [Clostridiales Family XIII bacterium]